MADLDIKKIREEKPFKELLNFSLVIINKPADWTSFDVVNKLAGMFRSLGIKKAGHLGTLDPMVTGVLPICLGNATKIQELFMHRDKVYVGKMKLHAKISKLKLEEGMKKLLGKIMQLPPVKSRVRRVLREREIKKFELIGFNEKKLEASFIAEVQAGTYIRKLVHDLGELLGIEAHMTELKRTRAGLFSEKDREYTDIETLSKLVAENNEKELRKLLVPGEIITQAIESYEVMPEAIEKLKNGSPLFKHMLKNPKDEEKIQKNTEPFCLISGNKLLEIAKITNQFENKEIIAKPVSVLN
jgi:H/ACA ribonucleoprotein complex subunit 4